MMDTKDFKSLKAISFLIKKSSRFLCSYTLTISIASQTNCPCLSINSMQIASTWLTSRFNYPFNLHPPIYYPARGLCRCNNPPVLLISPQDDNDGGVHLHTCCRAEGLDADVLPLPSNEGHVS